ncbi:MAG: dihydroxyacetone kinase subunit DhaK [Thiohalocapsa sp.]|uniref:dihydroxyacetone kinase subunit DhaK n=1 Tax=Thiohalocapsa sp. TaxID=2497641 RepID=UPI0025DA33C0|nr:dihydroxyacetone kinase subunit DhaK [Thiohalocapsa sp.]MCG6941165.1 dihydroxyacetone kinase subunit DhaK [Thiohalocapsa sp.]
MKKLINRPEDVVVESLHGLAAAHGDLLRVSFDPLFVVRADAPVADKVAIVSGGGSGHEPLHAGFVGRGMLDAACPGEVFTSPTPDRIEAATRAVVSGRGALHIVKNYTGDVLNFETAAELCRADGIEVEAVVVADDVAVEDSTFTAGRRGLGTTVLLERLLGAAAERGLGLDALAALARRICDTGRSMGVALTPCTVPAAGRPTFTLADDEIEIGVGIHGEPGRERAKLRPARELMEQVAGAVIDDLPFRDGDDVIVLLNGMGGTPLMELYLLYNELHRIVAAKGLRVRRRLVGNYITSLEMAGFSLTLLKADDELVALWDDPVLTPALRWGC